MRVTRKKANGVTVTDKRTIKSKKVIHDDIEFDSILEGKVYLALRDSGIEFEIKPVFPVLPAFEYNGEKMRKQVWTPDYYVRLRHEIIEAKGRPNEQFPVRLKVFKYMYSKMMGGTEPNIVIIQNLKELALYIKSLNITNKP